MAPSILPEYGFDPSCGNFEVKIVKKAVDSGDFASIQVEYSQLIDSEDSFYCASFPWKGAELSVADIEKLLNSANVPFFIQFVSAINMIFRCVDQIIKEREEAETISGRSTLPSILVKIFSDIETIGSDFEFDEEDS